MKTRLRQQLLRCRKELGSEAVRKKSRKIVAFLNDLFARGQLKTFFLYVPVRGEVDILPLVLHLWKRQDNVVCFPRCVPGQPGVMEFWRVRCKEDFTPGSYGIPEPDVQRSVRVLSRPDIVVLPGIGFDRQGVRLGYGGGYYDRFLAGMPGVFCVGVAFSCQLVERLPHDRWDRRVQYIVTEKESIAVEDFA